MLQSNTQGMNRSLHLLNHSVKWQKFYHHCGCNKHTSNLTLIVLLQWEPLGSLISTPAEKRRRLTPLAPERAKLSAGDPWTLTSGEFECCMSWCQTEVIDSGYELGNYGNLSYASNWTFREWRQQTNKDSNHKPERRMIVVRATHA